MKRRVLYILFALLFGYQGVGYGQINTERVMDIGRNALYFEDYILSIQYFNKVIRVKPYLAEPYFYRAIAKYSLDDYKGAQADCDKVLEINPFMINVFNLKGILQERMGDSKAAAAAFSDGLKMESTNLNLLFNRGISYINLKDYTSAVSDYTELLKYDPKNSSALGNRGMAKLAAGDTLGCIADLDKMVAVNSYAPESYTTRGMLFYKQGKFDLALNDLNKAIELSPNENANLYLNRGVIKYQLDDLRGTMADFDKVIELEPKNGTAYTNRGILRAQVGDVNKAIEDFSRVLALDPTDMMMLMYRGELFMQVNQYRKALNDFNVVAEEYPKYGPLYASRARAKQMLNDFKGAQLDNNTAMKLEHDRMERDLKDDKKSASKEKKETRKKSDKDLKNRAKLAVMDDFGDDTQEQVMVETVRGRVQNKDIAINLEPMFGLSFFTADSASHRRVFYNTTVDAFNKKSKFGKPLLFTNREVEEDGSNLNTTARYNTISDLSNQYEADSTNNELLLTRAVLYSSVLNFNSAIADYDHLIAHNPLNAIAYFNRAYSRFKMVEIIQSLDVDNVNMPMNQNLMGNKKSVEEEPKKETKILDYETVIADLDKVIASDGTLEYAYYNRGYVRSMNRNYDGALADFSKAIELNPYFAEAYYNRGLTLIYLREVNQGVFDLSKAGELGLYKAYNVIKRYGVKQSATNESEK